MENVAVESSEWVEGKTVIGRWLIIVSFESMSIEVRYSWESGTTTQTNTEGWTVFLIDLHRLLHELPLTVQ